MRYVLQYNANKYVFNDRLKVPSLSHRSRTLADPRARGGRGNSAMPHHGFREGWGLTPSQAAEEIVKGRRIMKISRAFVARFVCDYIKNIIYNIGVTGVYLRYLAFSKTARPH